MTAQPGFGHTVLITGASSGIGVALADIFAREGFDLVLTARRAERLIAKAEELQKRYDVRVRPMPADLARPDAAQRLMDALEADGILIDALVNNAGYAVPGRYGDISWEDHRAFLQVLMIAPLELTHRVLPGMCACNFGRILNIASVAGILPPAAGRALYGPVKTALVAFSDALHGQLEGTGVHVTVLCPGFTYTEFHDVNGTRAGMSCTPAWLWMDAERVAEEGYAAVMRGQRRCVPGWFYKVLTGFTHALPESMSHRIGLRIGGWLKGEKKGR